MSAINRKGFSLFTAIMVLLIMASIGVAILSISTTALEQKTQAFMRAQAELYAESGMEYAVNELLRRGAYHDGTAWRKPSEINITVDNFDIHVRIRYPDDNDPAKANENSLYMLIDSMVTGKIDQMPIRVVKRTVQLP
jgi:type II secretory pathway component PulK